MYLINTEKTVNICVSARCDFDKRVVKAEVILCDSGVLLSVSAVNNFEYQALTTLGKSFGRVVTVTGSICAFCELNKFGVVRVRSSYRLGEVKNNSLHNGGRQRVFCRYRL